MDIIRAKKSELNFYEEEEFQYESFFEWEKSYGLNYSTPRKNPHGVCMEVHFHVLDRNTGKFIGASYRRGKGWGIYLFKIIGRRIELERSIHTNIFDDYEYEDLLRRAEKQLVESASKKVNSFLSGKNPFSPPGLKSGIRFKRDHDQKRKGKFYPADKYLKNLERAVENGDFPIEISKFIEKFCCLRVWYR